ncbi:exocyst complex component EXO70E2-like [Papaver somniferum]|uniref:exocyst complex component EXO70E2-like n=1 Tax=Papaver somniferum TaxID=3469 RepID=UPI000E704107|nr:exocyst complex component EXO70E2-like [Papaver somniferum]
MLELLKYGEAIMDIEGQEPEKLFLKLDMYEVLRDLLPDNMFLAGGGRETVVKFEKAIGSNPSTKPFTGGGTHDIFKYVMKYIAILASDYSDTLGLLFGVPDRDDALRCIFLINNIFYMVSKVLRQFFGDYWIRQHVAEYQGYAMNYERATWRPILNLLRYEGMFIPGTRSVSKRVFKERVKDFNLSFEKVYKSQTAWIIPDPQLREERRINVFQAYRTVIWMHDGEFIKYSSDELQTYISDLFGGSPKLLPNSART